MFISERRERLRPEPLACRPGTATTWSSASASSMGDALASVATQFPTTSFAIVDFPQAALKGAPAERSRPGVRRAARPGTSSASPRRPSPTAARSSAVGGQAVPAVVAFLAGYEAGAKATGSSSIRVTRGLLAGLRRPGEVQGARADPDRRRLEGGLRRRRRLRPRRAPGGERAATSGASASTTTRRSSARTSSRAPRRRSTSPSSTRSPTWSTDSFTGGGGHALRRRERRRRLRRGQPGRARPRRADRDARRGLRADRGRRDRQIPRK